MTFKKGLLILLDYTAKIKDSGEVFETTSEDEAKKHSIHDPNVKYMPKLVSVGEAWVLKGLDDALPETKAGEKKTIEVSPDKGFGVRDKGKVFRVGCMGEVDRYHVMRCISGIASTLAMMGYDTDAQAGLKVAEEKLKPLESL